MKAIAGELSVTTRTEKVNEEDMIREVSGLREKRKNMNMNF